MDTLHTSSLDNLPNEIILEYILLNLDIKSIAAIAQTSKRYHELVSDELLWSKKLHADFNFPLRDTARSYGWKKIYKGMTRAQLYVWGPATIRLGLGRITASNRPYRSDRASKPVPLTTAKAKEHLYGRIVDVIAGGWSYHAITADGHVLAWGQMSDEGWTHPYFHDMRKVKLYPERLEIPEKIVSVSTGRSHALALSSSGTIWQWTEWAKFWRMKDFQFDDPAVGKGVAQISAGWHMNAVLCNSSQVFVWWDKSTFERDPADPDEVFEATWLLQAIELPYEHIKTDPFEKIAAGDNFVIGLTRAGKVYKFDLWHLTQQEWGPWLTDEISFEDRLKAAIRNDIRRWYYLENFSEGTRVGQHEVYANHDITPPGPDMKIMHIDAHFNTFFAYSTGHDSVVLRGDRRFNADSLPDIIPELQNSDVIKVTQGDWHFGAITSHGEMLVWGSHQGGLGIGNLTKQDREAISLNEAQSHVNKPTRIRFMEEQKKDLEKHLFVVNASFGGWHSSALILDLNEAEEAGSSTGKFGSKEAKKDSDHEEESGESDGLNYDDDSDENSEDDDEEDQDEPRGPVQSALDSCEIS